MLSLAFVYFIYARYHIQKKSEAGIAAIFRQKLWYQKSVKEEQRPSLLRFYSSWKVLIWLYWLLTIAVP